MAGAGGRSPVPYFLLVLGLSVPFWLARAAPLRLPWPVSLPASALMAFVPTVAALGLTLHESGRAGVGRLLGSAVAIGPAGEKWPWLLTALLLMPAAMLADFAILRGIGAPLPAPDVPVALAPIFLLVFLLPGLAEEIGWQGYAYERLAGRQGPLRASLLIGLFWASWHIIPNIQGGHDVPWLAGQWLTTLTLRVITAWLYVNGGRSVFVAGLFHAMCNVATFLFPVYGSHYDPLLTFLVLAPAAGAMIYWEPLRLRR